MAPTRSTTYLIAAGVTAVCSMLGFAETLIVGSVDAEPGASAILPIQLADGGTVGFQFDVVFDESHADLTGVNVVSDDTDHRGRSRKVSEGRRRIVVYSPANRSLSSGLVLDVNISLPVTSPDGGPGVFVENLIFTNADGEIIPATISYPPIDEWRKRYFTELELQDPDVVGDDRDPDNDGRTNLAERASGSNPKIVDPPIAELELVAVEGLRRSTLYYRKALGDTGVEIIPAVSLDLKSWSPEGVDVEPTGIADGISVEMRASIQSDEEAQFMRLEFRRLPVGP